ncbi:MAG TPA: hypothetical protein VLL52_21980 [Anaerolineae bacterium]|nr:hypothetical protein [Anaerolineae bacterium]
MKNKLSSIIQRYSSPNTAITVGNWHIQFHNQAYLLKLPYWTVVWNRPTRITVTPADNPTSNNVQTIPISSLRSDLLAMVFVLFAFTMSYILLILLKRKKF